MAINLIVTPIEQFIRLQRIRSYQQHSFYLMCVGDPIGYIRRTGVPTLYDGERKRNVFVAETSHKVFDVIAVPESYTVHATDDAATAEYMELRTR